MGLDMYLYRAEKPSQEEAVRLNGQKVADIAKEGYEVFVNADEYEELKELLPYCAEAEVITETIDIEKVKAANGVDAESGFGRYFDGENFVFTFYDETSGHNDKVVMSREEIFRDFVIRRREKGYFTTLTEVAYWRKFYDLDYYFRRSIGDVLNTGYYLVSRDVLEGIEDYDRTFEIPEFDEEKNEGIFYWSWY